MAYTNAIYYMDYTLGSDAARVNLVPSAYADNGVGLVRVTVGSLGVIPIVTDAIVKIAGTTGSVYIGMWKVTVIDANNIDLQGSVFTVNPAAKGTLIPNGGANWADAWKSISGGVSGAIAANIAPGDIIRIAKSPDPVSIGNATWTNNSKTVTLATAGRTLPVCMCEADWTAVHAVNCLSSATDWKEGTKKVSVVEDATPGVGEVQADFATGALDLTNYQQISFWICNERAILAGQLVLNLYTSVDASGAAAHSFAIPAIPSVFRWVPLTIDSAVANMTNGINSIALVNGAAATYTASKYVYLDNIIATKTGDINLQSLISQNSLPQGGTDGFYGIQSINGVTVLVDNNTNTLANAGRGYSGTAGAGIATYIRETIKTALAASDTDQVQYINNSGSAALGNIQFQGGYDTGGAGQTGETFFDGLSGKGYGLYLQNRSYNTINLISMFRYYTGVYVLTSSSINIQTISNLNNNAQDGLFLITSPNNTITTISNANNNYRYGVQTNDSPVSIAISNANNNLQYGVYIYVTANSIFTISNANNNAWYGVYFSFSNNNKIMLLSTTGNASGGVYAANGINYINKGTIAEGAPVSGFTALINARIFSQQEDGTFGNNWIYTDSGYVNSQAVTRVGASGLEWKITISAAARSVLYPLEFSLAKIAVVANKLVTITAYLTKGHATNVEGYIVCKKGQILGDCYTVDAQSPLMAANTNAQQMTITFTPTEAGVVEIMAGAYYVAANGTLLVDTVSITQAA